MVSVSGETIDEITGKTSEKDNQKTLTDDGGKSPAANETKVEPIKTPPKVEDKVAEKPSQ